VTRDSDGKTLAQVCPKVVRVLPDYCWDGVTLGPDHPKLMEASMAHDVLCQLIGEGKLARENQPIADAIFRIVCIENKVKRRRAWALYALVRTFQRIVRGI